MRQPPVEFLGNNLWKRIPKIVKPGTGLRVAVAYYTADTHIALGLGDTLIVNASEMAIQTRQTSARVLANAFRRGAFIYSHDKLHAKIISDDDMAIVGSANFSASSRGLRVAAILVTDSGAVAEVTKYFETLRHEAKKLKKREIEKLLRIPLVPVTRTVQKASLLEAISESLPSLSDISFGWYSGASTLQTKAVVKAAREGNVYLPHDDDDWTWYESENLPGVLKTITRESRDKPLVTWPVELDSRGRITRFKPHDSYAVAFIDALPLGRYVISIVSTRPFPTPFDLRRDRSQLAAQLTRGLKAAPSALRKAISNEASVISRDQLTQLFTLGATPST